MIKNLTFDKTNPINMKKINLFKIALLFVSVLSLSSCSSDDGGGNSNGTTTGNYWPMKVNNTWNFDNNGVNEQLKLTGTDQFGGITYYEIQDDGNISGFDTQTWVAKNGATYFQKIADINTVQNGVTISIEGYQLPIFRDDLAVNETWSGTLNPNVTYNYNGLSGSLPTTVTYEGQITARDVTETVNGVSYPNVIKMTMSAVTNVDGQTTEVFWEYWFAKDVGPIWEYEIFDNGTPTERHLTSFVLN